MPPIADFATLAAQPAPGLDELALALAAEFGPIDAASALAELDRLGAELGEAAGRTPRTQAEACRLVLGERHGFSGDREDYDHPRNSRLDEVLRRRRGLPILLSVVYVEAARRAGVPLAGVGLPGHFVVGHFGVDPPLLLDPFAGGVRLRAQAPAQLVRPWNAHETSLRMLSNLVASYAVRGDLYNAIQAAHLRLALPLDAANRRRLEGELRSLQQRLAGR
jgi:regulator of sirC expression with transglutaminase-like and TPR domain